MFASWPPFHNGKMPLQPPKPPPEGGVSVNVTAVLYGVLTEQSTIPAAGPQLMPPPEPLGALFLPQSPLDSPSANNCSR